MKDSIKIIHDFLNSEKYKKFNYFVRDNLDVKTACLGINIYKNKIVSIKSYIAYRNYNDLKRFLKIPFIDKLYDNRDKDISTISSPSISLKYYPEHNKFTHYFHLKFTKEFLMQHKKYFLPKHNKLNLVYLNKVGISIEDKKIIKYFYFSISKDIIPLLTKKFNLSNKLPNKIEYVEYSDKFKFILDEDTELKTLCLNKTTALIIEYIEKKYNLKLKTGGRDSKNLISLYFF